MSEWTITSCDVCTLVDGDVRQKPCQYCNLCDAWICEHCAPLKIRRGVAMFKRRFLRTFGVAAILLFALLIPARAQNECGSLQVLKVLNASDNVGILHQNACWNPTLLQLTFPLGPAGGPVSGSGTTNTVTMWTGATALGNSPITVSGNLISLPATGQWQNYHGLLSVGNSMAQVVGLAQGSAFINNMAPVAILASVPASAHQFFRVNCYLVVTIAATTSSTLPSCQVSWTDFNTSVVETATFSSTNSANTVGAFNQGTIFINPLGGTAINISTTGYASVGGTAMTYVNGFNLESL